jgi:4-hydroxy-tetrahydrodipicolinate synthase
MLVIGAAGLMNAVGNLAPARVADMCVAVGHGNLQKARELHYELFELNQAIFLDTNPIPVKYMMWRMGLLESAEVRLPLMQLSEEQGKRLDEVMCRAGLTDVEQAVNLRRFAN